MVIHPQVDGGSDARGFVLLMMLSTLMSLGWIDRATIASLIPGHTHEDIDALFSELWKALKTKNGNAVYRTWSEIMKKARHCSFMWFSSLHHH